MSVHTEREKRNREDEELDHPAVLPREDIKEAEKAEASATKDNGHPLAGKKKKYAIIFGYSGENFHGLQLNQLMEEKFPTIEKALIDACHKCGLIAPQNIDDVLNKTGWQRASRTDKGVHALRNIVSAKFQSPLDGEEACVKRLNECLPKDIRIYELRPVTGSFNCYLFCTGRKYDYYLPTYGFLNNHTYNSFFPPRVAPEWPTTDEVLDDAAATTKVEGEVGGDGGEDGNSADLTNKAGGPAAAEERMFMFKTVPDDVMKKLLDYRLPTEVLERARSLFKLYEGTNMFHNFTPGGRSSDASMHRYIRTVTVSDPFIFKGVEWVKIGLDGQSFMLNQIRKMIGCVCVVLAAEKPDEFITDCMSKKVKKGIPMAPANGLLLRALDFSRYNDGLDRVQSQSKGTGKNGAGCAPGKEGIYLDDEHHKSDLVEVVRGEILDVIARKESNELIVSRWMRSVRHVVRLAWDESVKSSAASTGTGDE